MAKAFTDDQRVHARHDIKQEGRRLFLNGGMKALSMSRLTDAAGIAKTSFYAFFPTMEDLILDLLADEAPGVRQRVMSFLEEPALSAPDALSRFLHALLEEYRANPLLARLIREPDTMTAVATRARPEDIAAKAAWMERPLTEFFEAKTATGEIARRPVQTLLDLVRSVSLLSLHRDRFGTDDRFDSAAGAIIEIIVDGMTNTEKAS